MHYGQLKNCDVANGSGVRVTLFVSGCTNRCPNCFQPETWDFNHGTEFTDETQSQIIAMLGKSYIAGLTVLGGEPFEPKNQKELLPFLKSVKATFPNKTIWMYSGFTLEQMREQKSYCRCAVTDEILDIIDVLVDGRYVDELRDLTLKFRGSSNQRLIDMNRTRKDGKIQLLEE